MNGACPKFYAVHDEVASEAERDCMTNAADKTAEVEYREYLAQQADEEKIAKEKALYAKIDDLEWRLQQVEERLRFQ